MVKKVLIVAALALAAVVSVSFMQREGRAANPSTAASLSAPSIQGRIVYARGGALWLYEGDRQRQLTSGPKDSQDKRDTQPSISPDGAEIVYVRVDEGFSDLYRLTVDNPSNPVAITHNRPEAETGTAEYAQQALWALHPAWSPNGERIAYTSDVRTEYPGLYSTDPEGGTTRKLDYLDHSLQAVEGPAWSPDGAKIAVANYVGTGSVGQVWVLDTESGKWTELTNAKEGAYDPVWSPDGEWIVFAMRSNGATNLYAAPTNAEKWVDKYPEPVQLTTDGASRAPAFSPDGTRLAYLALKDSSFDLYEGEFATDTKGGVSLENSQKLTDKANIDAAGGISWGP